MPNVIQASRNFVCVRMMTYESASEADVLKSLWRPDAPLENTVFAILDPTGRAIVRGGRSPQMVFRDADDMSYRMNEIARYYGSNGASIPKELPTIDTVRLAVDVAACDKRPLVIVVGQNDQERNQLAARLAPTAWSEQLIGKLVYTTSKGNDLGTIRNARHTSGFIFAAPNLFGTEGSAVIQLGADANPAQLASASKQVINSYHPEALSHQDHVRAGKQNGIDWKTAIPVTDPHSLEAQKHERGGQSFPPPGPTGQDQRPGPGPRPPRDQRRLPPPPITLRPSESRQVHIREYR